MADVTPIVLTPDNSDALAGIESIDDQGSGSGIIANVECNAGFCRQGGGGLCQAGEKDDGNKKSAHGRTA